MVQERCRVVSVVGLGGIGKSALVISAMHQLADHFQVVIFRSLRDAPSCDALLEGCLQVLAPESLAQAPQSLERRLRLLRQVAQTAHQSCLLLTSREKPAELRALEGSRTPVRALRLAGLEAAACEYLLTEHEVMGSPEERARLVQAYSGNPLALRIVAETIADLFGGGDQPVPLWGHDHLWQHHRAARRAMGAALASGADGAVLAGDPARAGDSG